MTNNKKGMLDKVFAPVFDKIKNFVIPVAGYKYHKNDNYVRFTSAFNFGLLCAVQVVALKVNSAIPDDVKGFLIPREITEGVMKVTTFLAIATGFAKAGRLLVKKGVILPKGIVPKDMSIKKAAAEVGKISGNKDHPCHKKLKEFEEGMANITNILGSIVGLSVVVPCVRNKIAAHFYNESKVQAKKPDTQPKKPLGKTGTTFAGRTQFSTLAQAKRPVSPRVVCNLYNS